MGHCEVLLSLAPAVTWSVVCRLLSSVGPLHPLPHYIKQKEKRGREGENGGRVRKEGKEEEKGRERKRGGREGERGIERNRGRG